MVGSGIFKAVRQLNIGAAYTARKDLFYQYIGMRHALPSFQKAHFPVSDEGINVIIQCLSLSTARCWDQIGCKNTARPFSLFTIVQISGFKGCMYIFKGIDQVYS